MTKMNYKRPPNHTMLPSPSLRPPALFFCLSCTAIRAVTKLGVLDVPSLSLDNPTPVSTLAQHTHCNEQYLYRLLRYVSQFGILVEEAGQQFR